MIIRNENYIWAWNPSERLITTHVILHHIGVRNASQQDLHNQHTALGWAGIAYHYYVRKDGSIFRGRDESLRGAHTPGMNANSISVCFEGDFDSEIMHIKQMMSGRDLIADICRRYPGIFVTSHADHHAVSCPGKHFPSFAFSEFSADVTHVSKPTCIPKPSHIDAAVLNRARTRCVIRA